jgi:hypothetical protein
VPDLGRSRESRARRNDKDRARRLAADSRRSAAEEHGAQRTPAARTNDKHRRLGVLGGSDQLLHRISEFDPLFSFHATGLLGDASEQSTAIVQDHVSELLPAARDGARARDNGHSGDVQDDQRGI